MNHKLFLAFLAAPVWAAVSFVPPYTLTGVSLTVPVLSGGLPLTSVSANFDRTYQLVASGGTGSGVLEVVGVVNAWDDEFFNQSTEVVGGWSSMDVNSMGPVNTAATGSVPRFNSRTYDIPFIYGTPFDLHIEASSTMEYWKYGQSQSIVGQTFALPSGAIVRGFYVLGNPSAVISSTMDTYDNTGVYAASAASAPEPSTWMLAGLGITGLLTRAKRRLT